MHGLVKKLMDQHPLTADDNSASFLNGLPNYSVVSVSYIIFVLKLLFGLDDNTER